jgi:hypothetical protein
MAPYERNQLILSVAWTWPAIISMLVFAMIPIWGPLLPPLEGQLLPVTSKVRFVNVVEVEGGLRTRMSYTKLRDCQILGVSMDRNGLPVEFEPVVGSTESLVTRGTGPQISREWFVGASKLDDVRLRWIHRCNPLWTVVTVAFP